MKIIDINKKEREVKSIKIITHKRSNDLISYKQENIDGELKFLGEQQIVDSEEKFVEAIILGKNTEWIEWYPLELFEKMNPTVEL